MAGAAPLQIACVRGVDIAPHLTDLARLRIAVFREFPYLYDGDETYEARYLQVYADVPDSVCVLVFDDGQIVGASTGLPLADETPAFRVPFDARGIAAGDVFYCAESVLLPAYRGHGLGHRFFDEREAHARRLGRFRWTAFAAVDRAADDPRRPPGARDHTGFWRSRGYMRRPDMGMRLAWRELGETRESDNLLTFWLRPLA